MNDISMPYSYHTFMYPFYWRNDEFTEQDINDRWKQVIFQSEVEANSDTIDRDVLSYATYQYFMPKARKLIFPVGKADDKATSVKEWIYKPCEETDVYMYMKLEDCWYKLYVNQVKLERISKMNIGILIFETENYGLRGGSEYSEKYHDKLKERSQEDRLLEITKINDLGRRTFSPYLIVSEPDSNNNVYLNKAGESPEQILLSSDLDKPLVNNSAKESIEMEQTPDGFEKLICKNDKEVTLIPAIDDRMFVVSCMGAEDLPALQSRRTLVTDSRYVYKNIISGSSLKAAELLYQIVFLERYDNLSCHDKDMLQQKLLDHVYSRWIDYGTIHGVTEYSFICITGCDSDGKLDSGICAQVINPFLTEYTEMAKIALLQRAEIIHLEDEVSDISRNIDVEEKNIGNLTEIEIEKKMKNISAIQKLWKKYILFQNELLLPEVTFQEQGVELYDMLKESFRLEKLASYMDSDMDNLHNMAEFEDDAIKRDSDRKDSESDNRLSRAVNLFSIMGISLALASAVQDALSNAGLYDNKKGVNGIFIIIEYALLLIANLLILYTMNRDSKQKTGNNEKKKNYDMLKYNWISIVLWGVTIAIIVINAFG